MAQKYEKSIIHQLKISFYSLQLIFFSPLNLTFYRFMYLRICRTTDAKA